MATTKTTTATAESTSKKVDLHTANKNRKALVEEYKGEEKVSKSISPLYRNYLGNVCAITLNGISIAIPVNGSSHKIPKSFADEVDSRLMAIDATVRKGEKMSNYQENIDSGYPGELKMF